MQLVIRRDNNHKLIFLPIISTRKINAFSNEPVYMSNINLLVFNILSKFI